MSRPTIHLPCTQCCDACGIFYNQDVQVTFSGVTLCTACLPFGVGSSQHTSSLINGTFTIPKFRSFGSLVIPNGVIANFFSGNTHCTGTPTAISKENLTIQLSCTSGGLALSAFGQNVFVSPGVLFSGSVALPSAGFTLPVIINNIVSTCSGNTATGGTATIHI